VAQEVYKADLGKGKEALEKYHEKVQTTTYNPSLLYNNPKKATKT